MKRFKMKLTIYYLITLLQCYYSCYGERAVEDSGNNTFTNESDALPSSSTTEKYYPCQYKMGEKRSFAAIGRRVSEAKCLEYHWDLQQAIEKEKNCERRINVIIGGRSAEYGEFPHMGALGWPTADSDWRFLCGSSLISNRFLLTAAHCSSVSTRDLSVTNVKPQIVRLGVVKLHYYLANKKRLGTGNGNSSADLEEKMILEELYDDIHRSAYDVDILRFIKHPEYASPKKYYDIAIVELTEAVVFDEYIQPACLWTDNDTRSLGDRAFATGWGYTKPDDHKVSEKLQVGEIDIIESDLCDVLLKGAWNRHFRGLRDHQLCAGVPDGAVDACQGDSGGPLQVKIGPLNRLSYVIGVTSFGKGCALPHSPGVYTRVSSFIDWIESVVWRDEN